MAQLHHPEAAPQSAFKSYQADRVSTTCGGMPFVTCYHGTKDGVLFPLADGGLLFHKPPFLVPANKLEGITTGGRGGANSRYIDLVVQAEGGALEFTNVNKEEMEGLQKFLALAGDGAADMEQDDDEQEEEEARGSRKRSKRKASALARRINKRAVTASKEDDDDEEEDDIDYIAGTAVDDDDDTDDDDDSDHCDNQDEQMGASDEEAEEEEDAYEVQVQNDAETEDETESEG
eukprot:scaffold8447_cov186-Amphora_coffeaeformis.AAC.6